MLTVSRASTAARFRVFDIISGHTVMITGLTISGGYVDAGVGGGIGNGASTLTVSNCIVSGNFSDAGAGGGGIWNEGGPLTIVDSVVSFNHAGFTKGNPVGYAGGINSGGTLTIVRDLESGGQSTRRTITYTTKTS